MSWTSAGQEDTRAKTGRTALRATRTQCIHEDTPQMLLANTFELESARRWSAPPPHKPPSLLVWVMRVPNPTNPARSVTTSTTGSTLACRSISSQCSLRNMVTAAVLMMNQRSSKISDAQLRRAICKVHRLQTRLPSTSRIADAYGVNIRLQTRNHDTNPHTQQQCQRKKWVRLSWIVCDVSK